MGELKKGEGENERGKSWEKGRTPGMNLKVGREHSSGAKLRVASDMLDGGIMQRNR